MSKRKEGIVFCEVYKGEKYFVARCLDVDVFAQGDTAEEAIRSLNDALHLYFEDEELPQGIPEPMRKKVDKGRPVDLIFNVC